MAKLRDLVNVGVNSNTIKIQGVDIPVIFTMKSFPFLEEAYGKPYHVFEKDLNRMFNKKQVTLGKNETRLLYALIYAMVRSGGTECTLKEIEGAVSLTDLPGISSTVMEIFSGQIFQKSDMDKIKTEKK